MTMTPDAAIASIRDFLQFYVDRSGIIHTDENTLVGNSAAPAKAALEVLLCLEHRINVAQEMAKALEIMHQQVRPLKDGQYCDVKHPSLRAIINADKALAAWRAS